MGRQERAEVTRKAILDGAARAFDAEGFHGTSLSDIVREAGVTKGALYFHFASKDELAQALADEQFSVWTPITEIDDAGVQALIDITHLLARELVDNVRVRAGIRLVIDQSAKSGIVAGPYERWIDVFRECLAQGQERGDVRADLDPGGAANVIVGSWTGLQLSSQVLTGRRDLGERTTLMWRMLLPGIVPPRRLRRFHPEGGRQVRELQEASA
ncbi:ScbR family autoregulator-binding transcription factor [Streptomyces cavernicola]|uniref:ScbR family autoregulator-binding transcription factor n=1 Tax=Streptomyces cavernicola TaxID=3043613 RepID=A0ABT6SC84_9ACTN|nr:ScbR family autoregulator-binding transcription factor [Streptomyces sp. B-S-A6]MDI3405807.1 ScbR family autoregulator-binding transcription factor [Streptomyces sp. B-S-A6]